jgi:hypothetical protein
MALGVSLVTATLSVVPGRVLLVSGLASFDPGQGVSPVAALALGPTGAWAAGLGYLLSRLVAGGLDALALVYALGYVVSGRVTLVVWNAVAADAPCPVAPARLVRRVGAFLVAALVGVTAAAAVVGWGYESLGAYPFFVGSALELPGWLLATVPVGVPALLVLSYLPVPLGRETDRASPRGVVAVAVVWFVAGTVLSAGYRVYELVPEAEFHSRGLDVLTVFGTDAVFGFAGARLQLVAGSFLFAALWLSLSG